MQLVKYNFKVMETSAERSSHNGAVAQALFVTFLWSTSWVLIKIGLVDIPALSFAGLRYSLAFLILLPFLLNRRGRASLSRMTRRQWLLLAALGLVYYTVVQGAQFLSLAYLPAATVSLTLNFTSAVVALMGMAWLNEQPGRQGWIGIGLSVLGGLVFFYPPSFSSAQAFGLIVAMLGMLANAAASVMGRRINSRENLSPLVVTTASMGIGGAALLALGAGVQGVPHLEIKSAVIVVWLAVVNTALAFTLWNRTLRSLSAMESSLINGTMMAQIAILAWIFLGESLTLQKVIGMILAGAGVIVVQLRRR